MHKYLRAIGFSKFNTKKQIKDFFKDNLNEQNLISTCKTKDKRIIGQYNIKVCPDAGISILKEQDQDDFVSINYYFPYAKGYDYTLIQDCDIERHSDKDSYAGIIDDSRLGMAIIFYLINVNEYTSLIKKHKSEDLSYNKIFLSALSDNGKIILPIAYKSDNNVDFTKIEKKETEEEIIDNLDNLSQMQQDNIIEDVEETELVPHLEPKSSLISIPLIQIPIMEDIDTAMYRTISDRYKKEDLYSIVETSIVPYGIECDKYLIIADILSVSKKQNEWTKENIVEMRVSSLGLKFNIIMNEKDLVGEPKPGRRFRGVIWLQGIVEFSVKNEAKKQKTDLEK